MNAIKSSRPRGPAVVVVMVVATAWTAPLGCVCCMHIGCSFLSIYSDASTIYRDSHSVKVISEIRFRTLSKWPTPRPPPASPAPRRFGGLVAGQGLRWAGHARRQRRCARDERADAATGERAAALARELVKQLGQMRGAAMKIGQVLSTVDFTAIPESEREEFKADARRAARRRPAAAVQARSRSCSRTSSAMPLGDAFADFERGGVRRRLDRPGPPRGHARRAPPSRSRSSTRASPRRSRPTCATCSCCCRWSSGSRPGSTSRRSPRELRERIAEELDYEIEAQNHRAMARALARPPVRLRARRSTPRSRSRRVLVTELLEGRRFEEVKQLDEAERDRFGEIVFRFFFGTLKHLRRAARRPAPRQLPAARRRPRRLPRLRADARRRRRLPRAASARSRAPSSAGDARRRARRPGRARLPPGPGRVRARARCSRQLAAAGEWYLEPGFAPPHARAT